MQAYVFFLSRMLRLWCPAAHHRHVGQARYFICARLAKRNLLVGPQRGEWKGGEACRAVFFFLSSLGSGEKGEKNLHCKPSCWRATVGASEEVLLIQVRQCLEVNSGRQCMAIEWVICSEIHAAHPCGLGGPLVIPPVQALSSCQRPPSPPTENRLPTCPRFAAPSSSGTVATPSPPSPPPPAPKIQVYHLSTSKYKHLLFHPSFPHSPPSPF